MKTFRDAEGREWTVSVDFTSLKRIRGMMGLALGESADNPAHFVDRMLSDPEFSANVLYCACKPECDQRGVSDEGFGRALRGDLLDAAIEQFLADFVDFFPRSQRVALAIVNDKGRRLRQAGIDLVMERANDPAMEAALVAKIRTDIDQRLKRLLDGGSGGTNSPGSPASDPTAAPSGS